MDAQNRMSLISLYVVLFIDAMGIGILMPLLSTALINPQVHVLMGDASSLMRNVIYGTVFTAYFITWLFGASFLGDLSDTTGRKKALMICMGGVSVAYLITAGAFIWHSLTLLFIGRIIAGLTAGSQPIAQAAITDVSPPEKLAQNIGFVLFFFTAGLVSGPIIGGVLSNNHWVSWFSYTTPLYLVTVLGVLNFLLIWLSFDETSKRVGHFHFSITKPIKILVSAFTHHTVRPLSTAFLLILMGYNGYYFFSSVLFIQRFAFDTTMVSIYMALVGVGLAIGTAVLPGFFERRDISHKAVILVSLVVLALGIGLVALVQQQWLVWGVTIPLNAAFGLAYSYVMGVFSRQVDQTKQGWVMGITGAILALSNTVVTAVGGVLDNYSVQASLVLACIMTVLGLWLLTKFKHYQNVSI